MLDSEDLKNIVCKLIQFMNAEENYHILLDVINSNINGGEVSLYDIYEEIIKSQLAFIDKRKEDINGNPKSN